MDKTPKIAALLSFAVLTFSVTHEWGYFQAVGYQFLPLMTPADFLLSALS
jgi:hypothetical protein